MICFRKQTYALNNAVKRWKTQFIRRCSLTVKEGEKRDKFDKNIKPK